MTLPIDSRTWAALQIAGAVFIGRAAAFTWADVEWSSPMVVGVAYLAISAAINLRDAWRERADA